LVETPAVKHMVLF